MSEESSKISVSKSEFIALLRVGMSSPLRWCIGVDEDGIYYESGNPLNNSLVAHDTLGDGWEDASDAEITDEFFGGHLDIGVQVAGFGEPDERNTVYVD